MSANSLTFMKSEENGVIDAALPYELRHDLELAEKFRPKSAVQEVVRAALLNGMVVILGPGPVADAVRRFLDSFDDLEVAGREADDRIENTAIASAIGGFTALMRGRAMQLASVAARPFAALYVSAKDVVPDLLAVVRHFTHRARSEAMSQSANHLRQGAIALTDAVGRDQKVCFDLATLGDTRLRHKEDWEARIELENRARFGDDRVIVLDIDHDRCRVAFMSTKEGRVYAQEGAAVQVIERDEEGGLHLATEGCFFLEGRPAGQAAFEEERQRRFGAERPALAM